MSAGGHLPLPVYVTGLGTLLKLSYIVFCRRFSHCNHCLRNKPFYTFSISLSQIRSTLRSICYSDLSAFDILKITKSSTLQSVTSEIQYDQIVYQIWWGGGGAIYQQFHEQYVVTVGNYYYFLTFRIVDEKKKKTTFKIRNGTSKMTLSVRKYLGQFTAQRNRALTILSILLKLKLNTRRIWMIIDWDGRAKMNGFGISNITIRLHQLWLVIDY